MKAIDNLLNRIAEMYEDGETGMAGCIDLYAEENDVNRSMADFLTEYAHLQGALEAGIPLAVVLGQRKLNDNDRLIANMPLKGE